MQKVDQIVDHYDYLKQQTFYMLIDIFKSTRPELVDKDHILQWRLEALAKMGGLTKRVVKLMAKETGQSEKQIMDLIKGDGLKVAKQMNQQLSNALHKPLKNVSVDTMAVIDSYAKQTFRDVNNYVNQTLISTNYGKNPAAKTYQKIVDKAVLDVVTGRKTTQQSIKDEIYKAYDAGMDSTFIDKGGHKWSIEGYMRTVMDSTTSRVFNDARMQSMKEYDTVLATMTSHPAARPACAPIQGHVVCIVPEIDSRYEKGYPSIYDYGYGEAAGTLGINCRHMLFPYVKGVSHNYQKQYDPEQAVKNAKIQQKQRYYERQVRAFKNKKLLAERIGDSKQANYFGQKIRANQANLRQLVKQHKFLARQYSRERIMPNLKEIDAKAANVRLGTQNVSKQNRHIPDTKEFDQAVANRKIKPSEFSISAKDIDDIIQLKADKKQAFQQFQYVDAKKTIGVYRDAQGNTLKTSRMKVMQSKNGYHAVPAPPKEMKNNDRGNKDTRKRK